MQIVEKQKKQDLGIFYTPPEVVSFVFDILNIWKNKEDKETKRWQSRKPRPHYPSIIDPAVGEGVFLKGAIESGFTKPDWIFGADIDEQAVKRWKEVNLLSDFGGKESDLKAHFFHQNGLLNIKWDQHKDKYKGKLRLDNIQNHQFDVAVGNPPYGGLGVYDDMKALSEAVSSSTKVSTVSTQTLNTLFGEEVEKQVKENKTIHKEVRLSTMRLLELKELSGALLNFDVWKDKNYIASRVDFPLSINNVPFNIKNILTSRETEKLKSFPIEILFVERFIKLVKPGGWIAVIIPDGILSNSNAHYVRDFIADKTKVEAIVSLPRETFKQAGTSAKTSILFLRKLTEKEELPLDHPVFLAAADKISKDNFQKIAEQYKKFYNLTNNTMKNSKLVQIIKGQNGKDAIVTRVDKTLRDLMTAKPNSRWDASFWLPKYEEIIKEIKDNSHKLDYFGNFIEEIGQGDVPRKNRNEKFVDSGVRFIEVEHIKDTGIYFYDTRFVTEEQYKRLKRVELVKDSILLVRSGATIGKVAIVTTVYDKAIVNGHINRIICKKINPYYVALFLKTKYGQLQLERLQRGVAQPELNFEEISAIEIAILDEKIQKNIESEYKKMSVYHDKAMEVKKKNNEAEYKQNIETAQKILKDLIAKTEAFIRGERKDVV